MTGFSLLKLLTASLAILLAGYYLYTGTKVYRMERGDFLPTPYDSSQNSRDALAAILQVAEPVSWALGEDGEQQAYFRPATNGILIVYLHGSPGNGAGFAPSVTALGVRGFGSLVIDLPGYGASDGRREWGDAYIESVRHGLDMLENRGGTDSEIVLLMGYSQGALIAAKTAAADGRVRGLVLQSGYTNLYDQLNHQFRWHLPGIGLFAVAAAEMAGVAVGDMDSEAALRQVRDRPLLVISGTDDGAIPISMAETLAGAVENGELWLVPGAGHVDLPEVAGEAYYDRIAMFAQAVADRAVRPSVN